MTTGKNLRAFGWISAGLLVRLLREPLILRSLFWPPFASVVALGGTVVAGGLNLGGSIETIYNPVSVVEIAIGKGAASILMPISSRRQLNELPDDLAAKITIHYYLDARDAL